MDWRKSTRSFANGNCTEAAAQPGSGIRIRDSQDREGPVLTFTVRHWRAFTGRMRNGEFGHPGR